MMRKVDELRFFEGNDRLFPEKSFEEYDGLKADIAKNGVKTELHVTADGVVLCGNQRLKIARELGLLELPVKVVDPVDREEYVVKDNLLRRHLSAEQKASLFSFLATKYEGRQGERTDLQLSDNLSLSDKGKTAVLLAEEVYGDAKKARSVERLLQYARITKNKPELTGKPITVVIKQDKAEKARIKANTVVLDLNTERCVFKNADALDYLAELSAESVDLVIIDPPYNIDFRSVRAAGINDFSDQISYEYIEDVFIELKRVMRQDTHIYCFAGFQTIDRFKVLFEKYFHLNNLLVWVKDNHTNTNFLNNYAHKYEFILFGSKGNRVLNAFGVDVLEFDNLKNKVHSAEKPLDLLQYLITQSSGVGQVVLDVFAGSGSTLKAAVLSGRVARGCEVSNDHYVVANAGIVAYLEGKE